ncbi:FAD-dependent monooxygenase [Serinicoccus marinus]|uniref:FAD-dependent monooxygenase n=1 Tax=Serinicoccus marinus TaxID=247333 RepID=UPI000527BA2A|nr:FAD-dependent monooxygenase [Serinicoccus marinus]
MRAVVSGAGISGLAVAHALTSLGWQVDLVEVAPGPRTEGYTLDLFGPGYAAAEELGVLDAISARGRVYRAARFVQATGRSSGELPLAAFAELQGGRFLSITRGGLEEALRSTLPEGARVHFGRTVADVAEMADLRDQEDASEDVARVRLDDGTELDADLVLICEGLHSPTRAQLFPDAAVRHLGFLTGAFSTEAPEVSERLGLTVEMSDTIGRQVGTYAMDDELVSTFTLARGTELPADRVDWLREQLVGAGPAAEALIARVPEDDVFVDVVAQAIAPRWRHGRVLLMGDAAHAVSLIAGQGASLAIAGAYALGQELATLTRPVTAVALTQALDRYETRWRAQVEPVQDRARQGASSFVPTGRTALVLRRLVVRATRLPLVARLVARSIGGAPTH